MSLELISYATHLIMEDRLDEANECLLVESDENNLLDRVQDTTLLDYLFRLDAFFDQHDLYLYDGWEDAQILKKPEVENFWVTLDIRAPKNTNLKAGKRLFSAKEDEQNSAQYKELEDGTYFIRIKVLRRLLDKIEVVNINNAQNIAKQATTEMGI